MTAPRWINTVDHSNGIKNVWYKYLSGAPHTNLIDNIRVSPPQTRYPAATHVWYELFFETKWGTAGIGMAIDGTGTEVDGSRIINDLYRRAKDDSIIPSAEVFQWDELPPIPEDVKQSIWIPGRADGE